MEIKDTNPTRVQYKSAERELKNSHEKEIENIKSQYENKIKKIESNQDLERSRLREDNQANNEMYSKKTSETVSNLKDQFKENIRAENDKFSVDRDQMKENFRNRLDELSTSFEKNKHQDEIYRQAMELNSKDRYQKNNDEYQKKLESEFSRLKSDSKRSIEAEKANAGQKRNNLINNYDNRIEEDHLNSAQKFDSLKNRMVKNQKEIQENFHSQINDMKNKNEERLKESSELRNNENDLNQKQFNKMQEQIKSSSRDERDRINLEHQDEYKNLEKRFSEESKNIKKVSDEKVRSGANLQPLREENERLVNDYNEKLDNAKNDLNIFKRQASEKEMQNDKIVRDNLHQVKSDSSDKLTMRENELVGERVKSELRLKNEADNSSKVEADRLKNTKEESDKKLKETNLESKNKLNNQKKEMTKFMNEINTRHFKEVGSLKEGLAKDKTEFFEKSKKDFSLERENLKDDMHRQLLMRDNAYSKKARDLEENTQKIVNNYENKIFQMERQSKNEMEAYKNLEEARHTKEIEDFKETLRQKDQDKNTELLNLRDKYEGMIGKDRILVEQEINHIVQSYEDQSLRDKNELMRDANMRLSEARKQYEILFKTSEAEKDAIRKSYEQRMESMRLENVGKTKTR